MTDGIIFDLDGTLWNTAQVIVQPWNEVFEQEKVHKRIDIKEIEAVMGWEISEIAQKFLPELAPEEGIRIITGCCAHQLNYLRRTGGILYDGLTDVLKKLAKQYPLFIVSNCEAGYIEAFYQAHGLGTYFTDVEFSGRTGKAKGENICLLMKRQGLCAPVYVGDTQKDGDACTYAGIPFVFAAYGFGQAWQFSEKITDITELPGAVERINTTNI